MSMTSRATDPGNAVEDDAATRPVLGVVIVTFNSADVIGPCVRSLLKSRHHGLRVVISDNASADETRQVVRDVLAEFDDDDSIGLVEWDGNGAIPDVGERSAVVTFIDSGVNAGYAGGVNRGMRFLASLEPRIDYFWILNPDCEVLEDTPTRYLDAIVAAPRFSLMGGRTLYHDPPNLIQSDGGRVSRVTGVCRNVNQGAHPDQVKAPDPSSLDFITGANFIVSRGHYEAVGPMEEQYFLYYEEVDWAMRESELEVTLCPEAVVLHHGGTVIGSGSVSRRPSQFANYFNYRNRLRFMWRFSRSAVVSSYVFSSVKIAQLVLKGAMDEALGAFRGLNQMRPPTDVVTKLEKSDAQFLDRFSNEFRESRAPSRVVLSFHGIGDPHEEVEPDEVRYWLPTEMFEDALIRVLYYSKRGQEFGLTFDDGNISDLERVAPMLAEFGLEATFFVLTGRLNRRHYLNADSIHRLQELGMNIGLHGDRHIDWRNASPEEFISETVTARRTLAAICGRPITDVSIPFGLYNSRVVTHLARQGFNRIYTSDGGYSAQNALVRSRTSIRKDMSERELDDVISGRESTLLTMRRRVLAFLRQNII